MHPSVSSRPHKKTKGSTKTERQKVVRGHTEKKGATWKETIPGWNPRARSAKKKKADAAGGRTTVYFAAVVGDWGLAFRASAVLCPRKC